MIGLATSKWKNLRMYCMMCSAVLPLIGFLMVALLPDEPSYKWTKWGGFFLVMPFVIPSFLGWTLIPSNVAGRTKRTLTSSLTFAAYCVGNMAGSQIYQTKDAVSEPSLELLPPRPRCEAVMSLAEPIN